jgi:hypothetical protein
MLCSSWQLKSHEGVSAIPYPMHVNQCCLPQVGYKVEHSSLTSGMKLSTEKQPLLYWQLFCCTSTRKPLSVVPNRFTHACTVGSITS